MMSIIKYRIRDGEYDSKVKWPAIPQKPAVLNMRIAQITADELASVVELKIQYDAEWQTYLEQKRLYAQGEQAGVARLRADLEELHGFSGHDKADLLWQKAWEHGHSSGFEEVADWYDDLSELVK